MHNQRFSTHMATKNCTKCGQSKDTIEFYSKGRDGRRDSRCKDCVLAAKQRAWFKNRQKKFQNQRQNKTFNQFKVEICDQPERRLFAYRLKVFAEDLDR